jgi:hypothetical protein
MAATGNYSTYSQDELKKLAFERHDYRAVSALNLPLCSQAELKRLVFELRYDPALAVLDLTQCSQAEIKEIMHHFNNNPRVVQALDISQCSQDDFKRMLFFYPEMLWYVEDQTDDMCYDAMRRSGSMIQHVKNQTFELCAFALRMGFRTLRYIRNPTPELYLIAVQQSAVELDLVPPIVQAAHPEICEAAVTASVDALPRVHTQTPGLCMLAVRLHGLQALHCVRDQKAVLDQFPDMYRVAVEKSRWAIARIKFPDCGSTSYVDLCLLAARLHGEISSVMELTPAVMARYHEICLAAVQHTGTSLQDVEPQHTGDHYPDICLAAVRQDARALKYVMSERLDHRYLELCWLAVRSIGQTFEHVNRYHAAFKDEEHYYSLQRVAMAPGQKYPWYCRHAY